MNKNILFSLILPVVFISKVSAYQWPIEPFTSQHQINGTLGEWKNDLRFHRGVDIRASEGTEVYHVVTGTGIISVLGKNSYLVMIDGDRYGYLHIIPNSDPDFKEGTTITGGLDVLGTVAPESSTGYPPHLHFQEYSGGQNPLRSGGLTPFVDNYIPVIENNSIKFYPDPEGTTELNSAQIYGKVDIAVNTADERTGENGNAADTTGHKVGIYRAGYEIKNDLGTTVVNNLWNVKFDDLPNPDNPYNRDGSGYSGFPAFDQSSAVYTRGGSGFFSK